MAILRRSLAAIVLAAGLIIVATPQHPANAAGQDAEQFCLDGCPTGAAPNDTLVVHHVLALVNNPTTKFADWVAYKLTANSVASGCTRPWKLDPNLPSDETLAPPDYRNIRPDLDSDRGHQAPLASLCGLADWREADYLSNITPQKKDLNEGPWEHLEDAERGLIRNHVATTVYSLTGTLYEHTMPGLRHAHLSHTVPSGYWKIVAIEMSGAVQAAGFVMDQSMGRNDAYCPTHTAISEIEQRTHLKFFPDLNEADRQALIAGAPQHAFLGDLGC